MKVRRTLFFNLNIFQASGFHFRISIIVSSFRNGNENPAEKINENPAEKEKLLVIALLQNLPHSLPRFFAGNNTTTAVGGPI